MLSGKDRKKLQKHIGHGEEGNFERVSDSLDSLVRCLQCEIMEDVIVRASKIRGNIHIEDVDDWNLLRQMADNITLRSKPPNRGLGGKVSRYDND